MAFSQKISETLMILYCLQILSVSYSSEFTIVNNCNFNIWPAVLSSSGDLKTSSTGFSLQAGESKVVEVPGTWSGRILGRTLCSHDSNGVLSCLTGDCGTSSTDECHGGKVETPATFAEISMNRGGGGLDMYVVSLEMGYNIPVRVEPQGGRGTGNCTVSGCVMDLNKQCPSHLKVINHGKAVACKNPCGDTHYCKPSSHYPFFKTSCPHARLFLYDQTPLFSCLSTNYLIKFCPSRSISYTEPQNRENPSKKFNWRGLAKIKIFRVAVILVPISSVFGIAYKFFSGRRCGARIQVEPDITTEL